MVLATQDLPKNMNLRLYCASLDLLARLGWQKLKIFIFQKFLKKWNFHFSSSTSTGKSYAELKIKGPPLAKNWNFQFFIFTQNLDFTRHAMHHWTYFGRNRKFWSDLYPLDQARTSNDPILNQLALAKDRIYPRIGIWHSSACPLTFWHIHNEKNWKILFFKNSWKNEISI